MIYWVCQDNIESNTVEAYCVVFTLQSGTWLLTDSQKLTGARPGRYKPAARASSAGPSSHSNIFVAAQLHLKWTQ